MEPTVQDIRREKEARLKAWVEKHTNNIEQGNDEWLRAKKTTIGGSEISTILGINPYMTLADLVAQKIGIKDMKSSIHMNWGNLFEPIITKYMEEKKNTKIMGENLFVVGRSPSQTYSPDGLAVVDFQRDQGAPKPMITLFEFKCPFSRKLEVKNPKVPAYYLPQVLTGLDTTIAEIGLYVEAVFRKCRLADLGDSNEYDASFTPRDNKNRNDPIAYGLIAFAKFAGTKNLVDDWRGDIAVDPLELSLGDFVAKMSDEGDLSQLQENDLACLLGEFKEGKILPWYSPILKFGADVAKENLLSEIYEKISKYNKKRPQKLLLYGILPWKLLKTNEIEVEKKEGYVNIIQDKIDEIISLVRLCHSEPDKKLIHYARFCKENIDDDSC